MSARDIDLDYTDDGETLERVLLTGSAALAMTGQNGASGRQMMGETLDVALAPDGSVTRATGRENVQLDFPASDGAAARTVKARLLDGQGEPGKGLDRGAVHRRRPVSGARAAWRGGAQWPGQMRCR